MEAKNFEDYLVFNVLAVLTFSIIYLMVTEEEVHLLLVFLCWFISVTVLSLGFIPLPSFPFHGLFMSWLEKLLDVGGLH